MRGRLSAVVAAAIFLLSVGLIIYGQWLDASATAESSAVVATATPDTASQLAEDEFPEPIAIPKVVIAPAPPESITIPELGFTVTVDAETTYEMAVSYRKSHPDEAGERAVYASGFNSASWPSDWRGVPGTDSQETVYLTCHSSSRQPTIPCNALAEDGVVQAGQHLVLTTKNGSVRYRLAEPEMAKKLDLTGDPRVQLNQPGRVLLMVCVLSKDGKRTDSTWLYAGQLVD